METIPFSQACENNKAPILSVLRTVFTDPGVILEIGAGTGQHAEHFARSLPHLTWQPSDQPDHHNTCRARLGRANLPNVLEPIALDVRHRPWPVGHVDGVFSANTAHIMGWQAVEALFAGVGELLGPGQSFCLYGPFNENGRFTSDSNARFDQHLRAQDAAMGIRDIDDLNVLARFSNLALADRYPMPANNQCLVWVRTGPA
ncbi:uncharacterized protein DUF938 [Tamilnaduibacter salinus]|uniref:Uncharacterized protein DUF938 n=1 Tax=Tamilnaduibacter salinus TaxID=1484056 RepID=A0A2U1CWL2_9GAMM|nr:DUF938 domain-containing protein [Tamilnaduibacter salinus]PVY76395.1 uncharacterized protein DUF938 [Tamilnaduibacter salinus]